VAAVPVVLLLALPITVPIAVIAVGVLRLTRDRPRGAAAAIAGVLLAVAGSMAASATLPRPGLMAGVGPGPVQLEWTVANHSRHDLELGVWAGSASDARGWTAIIPACFTTAGRSGEDADWFVTLERPAEGSWGGGTPSALVSAAQVPGADARVWLTLSPDGEIRVEPGRGAPPAKQLTTDHCSESSVP
jgi:hypothetical protein